MMGLFKLPLELMRLIAQDLNPFDLFHLALCAHYFEYILWDQCICRAVLQNYQYSVEYQEASRSGDYAKGLRRLVKRQEAVRNANPFHILQIANAHYFIYTHGAVCYTTGRDSLRVLHLQGPIISGLSSQEIVIDIQKLLSMLARPGTQHGDSQPYTFRPLHYAHGILSCLFSHKEGQTSRNYLIVCELYSNPQKESQVDSQKDLENAKVIGCRRLPSTRGLFVRNNGDYLYYGTRSEPAADGYKRWVLLGLNLDTAEWFTRRLILKDFVGAEIGSTVCFEIFGDYFYAVSNREMVDPGESVENSFYYAFRFRLEDLGNDMNRITQNIVMWRRQTREGPIDDRWNTLELSRDEQSGKYFVIETRNEMLSAVSQSLRTSYKMELVFPPQSTDNQHDDDDDDNDDLWDDRTQEMRSQHIMHYGDEGTSAITLTLNRTPVRCYNAMCQTFVDLIDDPQSSEVTTRRLRLRVRPQTSDPQPVIHESTRNPAYIHKLLSRNRDDEVRFWPEPSEPDSDSLYQVLNPQDRFDEIDSTMDERFLVYSPRLFNNNNEPRPIVVVSFDPALHFVDLPRFYPQASDGSATEIPPNGLDAAPCGDSPGSSTATLSGISEKGFEDNNTDSLCGKPSTDWITREPATYITQGKDGFPIGFDLSRGYIPAIIASDIRTGWSPV